MEDFRNWLELPSDIALMILMKIPQLNILMSVQFVCKPWYDLCKDPSMWRSIKFEKFTKRFMAVTIAESQVFGVRKELKRLTPIDPRILFNYEKMVLHVVDRSGGGLVDLDIEGFVPYELFSYIASRSTQLKRLRFAYSDYISSDALIKALGKFSALDELELTHCNFGEIIFHIKSNRLSLITLKLNKRRLRNPFQASDEVALVIAESLPQLRHLQLKGNNMTILGLTSILDECPHLQSLDVRKCFNLDLGGDLGKTLLKQFPNVQILYDSTEDRDNSTYNYYAYDLDDIPYVDTDFEEFYDFSEDESTF